MAKYFGTNGIRGKIDELTPELAYKAATGIGYALCWKKDNCRRISAPIKNVLIAMDARKTGPILKAQVIDGLTGVGCPVIDLGMISTPTAEFMVRKMKPGALVIITASHNPPEYNGLKVMDGNEVSVSKERGEEIEEYIDGKTPNTSTRVESGTIEKYENAVKDHVKAILKNVDKNKTKGKKLLLDYGNGMAATIAPQLFRDLGCEITSINSHIDGSFPGRPSEPSETNVQELIAIMKRGEYDCGIAWDGDGDRVIFVDEKGEFIIGDKVFAIAEILKLREKKGSVITTVATSKAIEDIAKKNKCEIIYTKIGAPYLSEEMAKGGAVLGGEEVGGVIWPEVSLAKDGFLTAAKLVEALGEKKLSEWLKEVPAYHNEKMKISANKEQKEKIMRKVKETATEKINTIDGVRIDFEDAWVIIRPSGTENYIRVFAEAKTREKAKKLVEKYKKMAEDAKT
ncbi:MAG: phosphoglucosamine mutase [Candidatus Micrarchaeota archaeon]